MSRDERVEACGCPPRNAAGHLYHVRGVCTDPVVARLNWYADLVPTWPCEAYGPDGIEIGAWCFVSDLWQRNCTSAAECAETMTFCRQQLHRRISELAAAGDLTAADLAEHFPTPDTIFRGDNPGLAQG